MGDAFAWEVELAQGRPRTHGGSRPMGTVCIEDDAAGTEYRSVPACVARVLARRQKSGELAPTTRRELTRSIDAICEEVAMERVAALIGRRDHARGEVRQKLLDDGFDSRLAERTVERAVSAGLVSDARFADAFVRMKMAAGWGLGRIERELKVRGIDVRDLPGWPYEYADPDEEYGRALEAASRKHVREPNAYAKMVRFLLGRGYSYEVSTSAAREALG